MITAKEPREGGAWEWHQDYGYWYNNGCLFPLMASAMIALDRCTKANGCLQVLRGSHLMGRIDHGLLDGDQVGASGLAVTGSTVDGPITAALGFLAVMRDDSRITDPTLYIHEMNRIWRFLEHVLRFIVCDSMEIVYPCVVILFRLLMNDSDNSQEGTCYAPMR